MRIDEELDRRGAVGSQFETGARSPAPWGSLWYDTVNGSGGALRLACEQFGVERLMLGTDYPFLRGDAHQHAVEYIGQSGLSAEDAERIYAGHAQAMLGLAKDSPLFGLS